MPAVSGERHASRQQAVAFVAHDRAGKRALLCAFRRRGRLRLGKQHAYDHAVGLEVRPGGVAERIVGSLLHELAVLEEQLWVVVETRRLEQLAEPEAVLLERRLALAGLLLFHFAHDLVSEPVLFHRVDHVQDRLPKLPYAVGGTAERDRERVLFDWPAGNLARRADAIHGAHVLAQHLPEADAQRTAKRRHHVRSLAGPFRRPGERHADLALRLDPLLHVDVDDTSGRPHADVLPGLLAPLRRETAKVAQHERADVVEFERTDDPEGEVARVAEALAPDSLRGLEVDLFEHLDACRTPAEVALGQRDLHLVTE